MRLGPHLRELRERAGLQVKDVAERLGVSPVTVSRWELESRAPSYEDLERWGRALGVEIDIVVRTPRPGGEREMSPAQEGTLARFARDLVDVPDDDLGVFVAMLDSILKARGRQQ